MLSRAWEHLDAGDLDAARAEASAALATMVDDDDRAEARLVIAQVDCMEGDADGAREALAEIVDDLAEDAEVLTDAGNLAFAIGELALASSVFDRAVELDDTVADAAYGCGLVARERGDIERQIEWFERTRVLDASDPDPPWAMTVDEFAAIAEAVLELLPGAAIDHLENVPIIVEPAPSRELVAEGIDPRLLGLFSGVPLTERSTVESGEPHLDAIHLYQRNLERDCASRDELEIEIRITVLHETAHFFGLEDDHLDDLGLG